MPHSVAEMAFSGDILHIDGQMAKPSDLSQYGKNGRTLAGWGVLQGLVPYISAHPDSMPDLVRIVSDGCLVDLRLAAMIYRAASGDNGTVLLRSDYGASATDCMWLVGKVGAVVLARAVRGVFALLLSQREGLPVSMSELERYQKEMVSTGNVLADLLHAACPAIFRVFSGSPEVDLYGLPLLDDGLAKDAARTRVIKECLVAPPERMSISGMANAYPGVEFVQRLVRYRRLRRDLSRVSRLTQHGRIFCESVDVDRLLVSKFLQPSLEEPAVRRLVRSEKPMWQVDFSDFLLVVAREYIRRKTGLSKFVLHDCDTLSDLGRIANGYREAKTATLRRYGFASLCGMVLNESALSEAVRAFGFKRGIDSVARVGRFRSNILKHYGDRACRDVWASTIGESLDANLSHGWRGSLLCSGASKAEHLVYSVVTSGNDPLSPIPDAVVGSVWSMLSEHSKDITIIDMVKSRKSGGDLFHSLFNHSASTSDGKVLSRCDRETAGLWSVFTSVHEAMREMGWNMLQRHSAHLIGIAAQELLIEHQPGVDADKVAAAALDSMRECSGGLSAPVDVTSTHRWR